MCQHGYQLLAMRLDEGAAERLQRSLQPYAPRKAALGARLLAALEPRQVNQRARELTRV